MKFKLKDRVRIHPHLNETGAIQAYGTIIGLSKMGDEFYSVLQKSHINHAFKSHRCGKGCLIVTCEEGCDLSFVETS